MRGHQLSKLRKRESRTLGINVRALADRQLVLCAPNVVFGADQLGDGVVHLGVVGGTNHRHRVHHRLIIILHPSFPLLRGSLLAWNRVGVDVPLGVLARLAHKIERIGRVVGLGAVRDNCRYILLSEQLDCQVVDVVTHKFRCVEELTLVQWALVVCRVGVVDEHVVLVGEARHHGNVGGAVVWVLWVEHVAKFEDCVRSTYEVLCHIGPQLLGSIAARLGKRGGKLEGFRVEGENHRLFGLVTV